MTITCLSEAVLPERQHPESRFLKASAIIACLYLLITWNAELFLGNTAEGLFPTFSSFSTAQHESAGFGARLLDFAGEIVPFPVREGEPISSVVEWAGSLFVDYALEAAGFTLCIALLSVLLAAAFAYSSVLLEAAVKLRLEQAYKPKALATGIGLKTLVRAGSSCLTGLLVLMRAVPDLIWAYIILSVLGPTYWTAIAALAIHNCGILGRIGRDIIHNSSYRSLEALRNSGASSTSLVVFSMIPELFSKFLIHVFYRWEMCMRDAVIVGMIGLPTLGFWIFQDAWPKFRYDEMMFYILLSVLLIACIESISRSSRRLLGSKRWQEACSGF